MKIEELESSIDKTASLVVELKSKIDETAMKITPKAVVAFRVTCIKNYPQKFPNEKIVVLRSNHYVNGIKNCPAKMCRMHTFIIFVIIIPRDYGTRHHTDYFQIKLQTANINFEAKITASFM